MLHFPGKPVSYSTPPPVDPSGEPMLVDESEVYDPVRDERACDHLNVSYEAGQPNSQGTVAIFAVCEDCGAETFTDVTDTVL